MKKNVHEIEIKLTKEWCEALDDSYKKNVKDVKIDGFRKGQAPKEIYIKKLGIETLYDDAINSVMSNAYQKVLSDNKLKPVVQPNVDVTGISDSNIILKFRIITAPEVTLDKYKNLGVKKEKITISEEEINEEINNLKNTAAEQIIKKNGKVEKGDTVVIDFTGYVDGEKLEGGSGSDYSLEIGSNTFIPGFEEKLIGAKLNQDLKLELKFPENYVEHLKNKDAIFNVKIKEITTKKTPELNSEFYKDLGYDDIKTEAEFKKKIKAEIQKKKEVENDEVFIGKCLEKISETMKIDINDEIIHEEVHRMMDQYTQQLEMQGMNLEAYFQMTGTTQEDLHKLMEPEAEKRIKYSYLIEKVADLENIKLTKKEVDDKVKEMAKNYNISTDEFINAFGSIALFEYDMKMQKALEIIKNNN